MKYVSIITVFGLALSSAGLIAGCKDESNKSATPGANAAASTTANVAGAHTNQIVLGETTVNGLKIRGLQDEPIKPGGEGAFDLQVTGYPAGGKPRAVRFWVGTESGDESVKALAAEETPDNWHTHAEVPNPIPAGSKFWAEIEPASGEKFKVSFDLRRQ